MARFFTEGFELGLFPVWMNTGEHSTITTGSKRSGSRGMHLDMLAQLIGGYAASRTIIIPDTRPDTELYFRAALKFVQISSTTRNHLSFKDDSGVELCRLQVSDTSMTLYVLNSLKDTWSPVGGFNNATWYLVEVHLKQDDSTGEAEIRIDGTSRLTFSGDTKSTGSVIRSIMFSSPGDADISCDLYVDDIAINDLSGAVDNSWCGEGKVLFLTPNANGDSSEWVGSDADSTDNYLLVDEIPNDGDTTYVQTSDADQIDLYGLSTYTLGAGEAVRGLQVLAVARCVTAESDQVALGVKATSEHFGDAQALTTSYAAYAGDWLATNPDTSAAWSQEDLDALQAGIKSA